MYVCAVLIQPVIGCHNPINYQLSKLLKFAFKHRLDSGRYCIVARHAKDEISAAAIAERLDNPVLQHCRWNFSHTMKLYSIGIKFYLKKTKNAFEPPFRKLRDNVRSPSIARWKARGRLWPKLGGISSIRFWDVVFTRFSGRMNSRMHSRTNRPEYSMPSAPFFNGARGIKCTRIFFISGNKAAKHVIAVIGVRSWVSCHHYSWTKARQEMRYSNVTLRIILSVFTYLPPNYDIPVLPEYSKQRISVTYLIIIIFVY